MTKNGGTESITPLSFTIERLIVPGHCLVCKALDTSQVKGDGQEGSI